MPDHLRRARRGRVHARGDRLGVGHDGWDVESTTIESARQAAHRVGGLRGRVMAMHDDESTNDPMDAAMDDRLRAMAGESYNAASGAVPREEMWSRISAARRAARVAPATVPDESRIAPTIAPAIVPLRRGRPAAWRWSAALAAGLILGVVVDRRLARRAAVVS